MKIKRQLQENCEFGGPEEPGECMNDGKSGDMRPQKSHHFEPDHRNYRCFTT